MTAYRALIYYLRSKTNLVVASCGAIALVICLLLRTSIFGPIGVAVSYTVLSVAITFSRRGAKEIVQERDEQRIRSGREKMTAAADLRDCISRIRFADYDVKKAVEHYLLVSAQVLESARCHDYYHPEIPESINQVYDACGAYLRSLDEHSSATRYDSSEPTDPRSLASRLIELILAASRRLDELRKIELPEADDLDIISRLDEG